MTDVLIYLVIVFAVVAIFLEALDWWYDNKWKL